MRIVVYIYSERLVFELLLVYVRVTLVRAERVSKRLLTTQEVAAYLRVSRATVWRWCQEQRLPAFKIGREWRISQVRLHRLTGEEITEPENDRQQVSAPS